MIYQKTHRAMARVTAMVNMCIATITKKQTKAAGWANGFIVNPTLSDENVGLRKARSPTYMND